MAILITQESDPDVMTLIEDFSTLSHLKPTTAIKQYLLQTLPAKIAALRADNTLSVGDADKANKAGMESQQ